MVARTQAAHRDDRSEATAREFGTHRADVAEVRRFVAGAIGDFAAADDVVLCASEIATNAVMHGSPSAGARITVEVRRLGSSRVYVAVTDHGVSGAAEPRLVQAAGDAESFRGLAMVDAIATTWGTVAIAGAGHRVWFEVVAP